MASSNQQHPPNSTTEFSSTQASHTNHLDPTTQSGAGSYAPNDNQLAGLVEAATAAAGQDVHEWAAAAAVAAAAGQQHHLDGYGSDIQIDDDGFGDANFASMSTGRQLRGSGGANDQVQFSGLQRTVSKKRKRGDDNLDPALTGAGDGLSGTHHGHQHQRQYDGDSLDIRAVPPQSLSEARAVGVHSAAALFRQPSSNKKYTRPPMSKMFSSLELSPENFLHLQAAAKAYMLDERHPERRDCVGQRGKGDSEMVKLRLWNCVRQFLEQEGHGERFFGEHVVNEGMGPRMHVWPRDQQKIISLVIPLLRRMVTNERQRQYAIETRKGGEERRRRKTDDTLPSVNTESPMKFPGEEQMHMQPQHHLSEAYPPHGQIDSMQQTTDLGLTDLLLNGYSTDWNSLSKSYDFYNHDYELDNLWSISGLQQPDWRGLVAAVDSHYHVVHNGDYQCPTPCEDENIHRIMDSDSVSALRWRIGGRADQPARNELYVGSPILLALCRTLTSYSGTSITRDISRIIREALAKQQQEEHQQDIHHPVPPTPQSTTTPSSRPYVPNPPNQSTSTPLTLHINILQNNKRVLRPFSIPADECPMLEILRMRITRHYGGQLPPAFNPSTWDSETKSWRTPAEWKFRVWLPDGLAPVQNDGEWTIALLSAGTVDWMDGGLRVLVEVEGEGS